MDLYSFYYHSYNKQLMLFDYIAEIKRTNISFLYEREKRSIFNLREELCLASYHSSFLLLPEMQQKLRTHIFTIFWSKCEANNLLQNVKQINICWELMKSFRVVATGITFHDEGDGVIYFVSVLARLWPLSLLSWFFFGLVRTYTAFGWSPR